MYKERFQKTHFIYYKPVVIECPTCFRAIIALDIDDEIDCHTPIHYQDFKHDILKRVGNFAKDDEENMYKILYDEYFLYHMNYPVSFDDISFDTEDDKNDLQVEAETEKRVKLHDRRAIKISKKLCPTFESVKNADRQLLLKCRNMVGKQVYLTMLYKIQKALAADQITELDDDFIIWWR